VGINPGQSVAVSEPIAADPDDEASRSWASGGPARNRAPRIDVAFIGSCTNGRRRPGKKPLVSSAGRHVRAARQGAVVPGSKAVSRAAEARGLHEVFIEAGFECAAPAARCASG